MFTKHGVLIVLRGMKTPRGAEGGIYKYIGESARSAYERGANHLNDRKSLDLGSHMLKHAIQCHGGADPEQIKFHMRVLQFHKSSLERQIDEAVKIQLNRQYNILNSKSEYNRSSIPRLGVKMEHKVFKSRQDYDDDEQKNQEEKMTEEKIRQMRKQLGKRNQRRKYDDESSAPKRRNTGVEEYI